MKKYLAALAAALMVCMLGMTASAVEVDEDAMRAGMDEELRIVEKCYKIMDEIDPDGVDYGTEVRVMTKVFREAGWTVTQMAPVVQTEGVSPETLELAYTDISKAGPGMREKILSARETVIFRNSWINDMGPEACFGYAVDPIGKEIEFQPLFSELFPGWDAPRPAHVKAVTGGINAALDVAAG